MCTVCPSSSEESSSRDGMEYANDALLSSVSLLESSHDVQGSPESGNLHSVSRATTDVNIEENKSNPSNVVEEDLTVTKEVDISNEED